MNAVSPPSLHCPRHLFRLARAGKFPQPINFGPRSNRWICAQVQTWVDAPTAQADALQGGRREVTDCIEPDSALLDLPSDVTHKLVQLEDLLWQIDEAQTSLPDVERGLTRFVDCANQWKSYEDNSASVLTGSLSRPSGEGVGA